MATKKRQLDATERNIIQHQVRAIEEAIHDDEEKLFLINQEIFERLPRIHKLNTKARLRERKKLQQEINESTIAVHEIKRQLAYGVEVKQK